jgi:hypothetical protein
MKIEIKGFKGFDKNLKCRGFQFEENKEYEENEAKVCNKGFHFCENPFDVWKYYNFLDGNVFHKVVGSGIIDNSNKEDTKISTSKIKIGVKLSLADFINSGIEFIFEKSKVSENTNATSGYNRNSATSGYNSNSATSGDNSNSATSGKYGNSATSGDNSNSATSGDNSNSATSGDNSNSATSGDNTISAAIGIDSFAKANIGSWIVVSEWEYINNKYIVKCIKSAKIDGKKLKPDTFYKIVNGKFTPKN